MAAKLKLNDLYTEWENTPNDDHLNTLLAAVRERVLLRYVRIDGDSAEDIAQNTILQVWKSVTGQIKSFDKKRGDFASYCATAAKSCRYKYFRSDRLICVADETLQQMIDGSFDDEE
jgi:DNA-directed RNA polymerase specialized sigma24 family protein